jgi:Ca-activated chloride channel family protein
VSDVAYKLDELARAAGISARTVRYYVQRGLLPAPAFRGKDTAYGHEHLVRLRAIRRLQDAFFPLDAIAVELEGRSLERIERLADGSESPTRPASPLAPPRPTLEVSPPLSLDATVSPSPGRTFRRIELAPGLELSIAEDAPSESRRVAERILEGLHAKREGQGA